MIRKRKNLIVFLIALMIIFDQSFFGILVAQAAPTFNESPVVLPGKGITFNGTPNRKIDWTSYDGYSLTAGVATSAGNADTVDGKHVGTLTNGKWCSTDGATITCTNNSPLMSYTETDPLVYAWAKAATKPSYSFTEITSGTISATTGYFSGNVGIGKISSNVALDVAGNVSLSGILNATGGTFGTLAGSGARMVMTDNSGNLYATSTTVATGIPSPSGVSGYTLRSDGSSWVANNVLYNNGTNVGIGTTNPGAKLAVYDSQTVSGDRLIVGSAADNSGEYTGIRLQNSGLDNAAIRSFILGGSNPNSRLGLFVGDNVGNSLAEKLSILANGNVGIGTTNPTQKLDVQGGYLKISDTVGGAAAFVQGSASVAYFGALDARRASFGNTDNFETLTADGGNVGINTASPGTKLDVNGYLRATGATISAIGSGIIMADSSGNLYSTSTTVATGIPSPSGISGQTLRSNGSSWVANNLLFNDGTNVGIGTTAPGAKMDIVSSASAIGLNIRSTAGQIQFYPYTTTGNYIESTDAAGTTSRLLYFTGYSGTAGTFAFNGNVGIGTTTPGYLLDVYGTSYPTIAARSNSASGGQLALISSTNTWDLYNQSGDLRFYSTTATAGDRMTITSTGNIGIGTTNPGAKLHLSGGQSATSIKGSYDAAVFPDYSYTITQTGAADEPSGTRGLVINANLGQSVASYGIGFAIANSNKMFIRYDGNVGVNTTAPGTKLDVNGLFRATGATLSSIGSGIIMADSSGNLYSTSTTVATGIPSPLSISGYTLRSDGNNWVANNLLFNNGTNVGIGTTNPGQKLEVNGDIASNHAYPATLMLGPGNTVANYGVLQATSNTLLTLNPASWPNVAINGNVGIGTTNPVASLQIGSVTSSFYGLTVGKANFNGSNINPSALTMGTINISSDSRTGSTALNTGYGPSITFTQNVSQYVDGYERVIGAIKSYLTPTGNTNSRSSLGFFTHNDSALSERMTIDYSGNVGIGTTAPLGKLESINTVGGTAAMANADAVFGNSATGNALVFGNNIGNYSWMQTFNSKPLVINPLGNNIGIGQTNPTVKLQITGGGIDANGTINGTGLCIGGDCKTSWSAVGAASSGWSQNGTEVYKTNTSGNVGIGTTAPNSRLSIQNNAASDSILSNYQITNGNNAATFRTSDTGPIFGIHAQNSGDIYIKDSSDNVLFYGKNGGNVGIGTTNPMKNLHIYSSGDNTSLLVQSNIGDLTDATANIFLKTLGGTSNEFGKVAIIAHRPSSYGWGRSDLALAVDTASDTGNAQLSDAKLFISGDTGNVGIGTTSPNHKMNLYGTGGGSGGGGLLGIDITDDQAFSWASETLNSNLAAGHNIIHFIGKQSSANNGAYFGFNYVGAGSTSNFATIGLFAADNLLNIQASGNVGINQTNPTVKLQVTGGGIDAGGTINGTGLCIGGDCKASWAAVGSASSGWTQNGTEVYKTNTSGNVGIGTTAPVSLLEISKPTGGVADLAINRLSNANDYARLIFKTNGTPKWYIGMDKDVYPGADKMMIYGPSGLSTTFDTNGSVGIGTTAPGAKLDVRGRLYIEHNAASETVAHLYQKNADGYGLYVQVDNADTDKYALNIAPSSGTSALYVQNNGNVGINKTAPGAALDVVGAINSNSTVNGTGLCIAGDCRASWAAAGSYWTGSGNNISNNNSGNVGIGTAAPKLKLEVAGTNATESGTLTPNGSILVGNGTASNSQILTMGVLDGTGNHAWIQSRNNTAAGFYALALNPSGGNVGIATTTPAQKLSVGNATNDLVQSYGGFIGHPNANIGGTGDAAYFPEGIYSGKMNWLYGGINMNNGNLSGAGSGTFSGNVGIGTTNPGNLLHVFKNSTDNAAFQGLVKIQGANSSESSTGTFNEAQPSYGIEFRRWWTPGGAGYENPQGGIYSWGSNSWGAGLAFRTAAPGGTNYTRMVVTDTGNVGINTASPGTKLDVNGYLRATGATISAIGSGIIMADSSGNLYSTSTTVATGIPSPSGISGQTLRSNGTSWVANNLLFNDGTNVGIGTATPGNKLAVNGDISGGSFTASVNNGEARYGRADRAAGNAVLQLGGGSASATTKWEIIDGGWTKVIASIDNRAPASSFVIDNSGNIGIGAAAPGAKLHILGSSQNTLAIDSPAYPEITLRVGGVIKSYDSIVTTAGGYMIGSQVGDRIIRSESGNILISYSSGAPTLTVASTGSVGIGTTLPTAKLDVRGDLIVRHAGDYAGVIRTDSYNGGHGGAIKVSAGATATLQHVAFGWAPSGSTGEATFNEIMRVEKAGNVGINQTGPTVKLQITGGGIDAGGTINGTGLCIGTNCLTAWPWLRSNNNAYLNETGNVGIGITNPTAKLHLVGGMILNRTAVGDTNYTALGTDYIIAFTSLSTNRTLTLPTALCASGRVFIVVNETSGANSVIIDPEGTTTIVGQTTITLPAYNSAPVYCNGTSWFIY